MGKNHKLGIKLRIEKSMSAHAYTDDQQAQRTLTRPLPEGEEVQQPAIGLFAELGWSTVSALEETFGATGTLLRETKGEVVLVSRLRAALGRLNPALPPEAVTAAVISAKAWISPGGEMRIMTEIAGC